MAAFYNENDPFAAAWLRNLIAEGLIADGEVDERSITEVRPEDLKGFTQCHFFAGIGVWSHALRSAGWPDSSRVWTGSCPCQSFSASGKRGGFSDQRHLWPAWFRLIGECKPLVLFGEQVASKDGLAWFDVVSSELEGAGYTIGSTDLPACGFGAPHIRNRLFFVAHTDGWSHERSLAQSIERSVSPGNGSPGTSDAMANAHGGIAGDGGIQRGREHGQRQEDCVAGGLANSKHDGGRSDEQGRGSQGREVDGRDRETGGMEHAKRRRRKQRDAGERGVQESREGFATDLVGNAESGGRGKRWRKEIAGSERYADGAEQVGGLGVTGSAGSQGLAGDGDASGRSDETRSVAAPSAINGFWRNGVWIACKDGSLRPTEPTIFPLVDGPSRNRVGLLRGAGNAIVAPVAQAFIEAFLEVEVNSRRKLC